MVSRRWECLSVSRKEDPSKVSSVTENITEVTMKGRDYKQNCLTHNVAYYPPELSTDQDANYQPVDIAFKFYRDPKVVDITVHHDPAQRVMGAAVSDKLISEKATSYYSEPVTDGKGLTRLDAIPGTYRQGRWNKHMEMSNV